MVHMVGGQAHMYHLDMFQSVENSAPTLVIDGLIINLP